MRNLPLIARIGDYLTEYHETWPDRPLPSPDEVHAALDCAAEPTFRSEVREQMESMDRATAIAAMTLLGTQSANPIWCIYGLERRGCEGAAKNIERGRAVAG